MITKKPLDAPPEYILWAPDPQGGWHMRIVMPGDSLEHRAKLIESLEELGGPVYRYVIDERSY